MSRTRRGCRTASVLLGTAVAAALPATAEAHHVKSVAITGPPLVGATLTATVVFNEVAPVEYRWQRCSGPLQRDCDRIQAAADAPTYTLVPADRGAFIAVRVLATADADTESRWSDLTTVVTDPPAPTPTPSPTPVPTPVPTPEPTPEPEPEPGPGPGPVPGPAPEALGPGFSQSGTSPLPALSAPSPAAPATARFLRPFPVVRVKGRLVAGGADVALLRVQAPAGATVAVRCDGPGCRLDGRWFGTTRVRALERVLRAGARITIRITRPLRIGKYVRLVIRDGSAPKRHDACLLPGSPRPERCPAA